MDAKKIKDFLMHAVIWLSALLATGILLIIVVFIFSNGWQLISMNFITRDYVDTLRNVSVQAGDEYFTADHSILERYIFIESVGLGLELTDEGFMVRYIASNSPVKDAVDNLNNPFPINVGHVLVRANGIFLNEDSSDSEVIQAFKDITHLVLQVRSLGGGVWPLIVTTMMLIGVTLFIAAPIGILAAIFMVEYAKQGKGVGIIRFAIEILSGMPSVVYGLFGFIFFTRMLNLGSSVLSGALTMTILLFPIIIRSTEEALKTVPNSYREASFGLGANKIQTIRKVILPSAIPGMMVGLLLSIGRIVGETAALLFTLGTFARMPVNQSTGNLSILEQGATLTLRAYVEVRETGNVELAAAIGIVILVIVFSLNMISKLILKKFSKVT